MFDVTEFAQLAVRAADLADRLEAAGYLSLAASVRAMADEVEMVILRTVPPEVVGWGPARPRGTERALRLVRPDPDRGRAIAARSRARSAD